MTKVRNSNDTLSFNHVEVQLLKCSKHESLTLSKKVTPCLTLLEIDRAVHLVLDSITRETLWDCSKSCKNRYRVIKTLIIIMEPRVSIAHSKKLVALMSNRDRILTCYRTIRNQWRISVTPGRKMLKVARFSLLTTLLVQHPSRKSVLVSSKWWKSCSRITRGKSSSLHKSVWIRKSEVTMSTDRVIHQLADSKLDFYQSNRRLKAKARRKNANKGKESKTYALNARL